MPGPLRTGLIVAIGLFAGAESFAADYASLVPARCIHDMGEWGEEAVHECIRRDLPAAQALERYPASADAVIGACVREAGRNGWAGVKACVDAKTAAPSR